jgi:hypothetical protein
MRSLFVKVPAVRPQFGHSSAGQLERPDLFQTLEHADMHRSQYAALTTIYQYFSRLDNKQLGAIRPIDYLPRYDALFTEGLGDPILQQIFLNDSRLHSPSKRGELIDVFKNAGAWLNVYHSMPKEADVQVRRQNREDYLHAMNSLTDYLSRTWGDEQFFKRIAATVINKGRKILPETLPLGLGHGDYAMRNILVGPHARVTVLNTFASWQAPIYEDIGYFLNGFKLSFPQIASQGFLFSSSQLRAYEHAFLRGYFASNRIPYNRIRLYEILALLDKWSSLISHYYRQTARFRALGRVKIALASRYFKKNAEALLRQIDGIEIGGKSVALEGIH